MRYSLLGDRKSRSERGENLELFKETMISVVGHAEVNVRANSQLNLLTVKPLLSGHLRDLSKCPLNRGCPLNKGCKNCAMLQHSTITPCCDKVAFC